MLLSPIIVISGVLLKHVSENFVCFTDKLTSIKIIVSVCNGMGYFKVISDVLLNCMNESSVCRSYK